METAYTYATMYAHFTNICIANTDVEQDSDLKSVELD